MPQTHFKNLKEGVLRAIEAIRQGQLVLVTDSASRENEGDLIIAAEKITPEKVAQMVRDTTGIICISLLAQRLGELKLPQMVENNTEIHRTAFTLSVDYRHGTTTGVSAQDRSKTLRALADPLTLADDFLRPGHIFPLQYRNGGVLQRAGHTEAALDLARLAGCYPAGVLCELVAPDGSMARGDFIQSYSLKHEIPLLTIQDLIAYRYRYDDWLPLVVESRLPTKWGEFRMLLYRSTLDGVEHRVLLLGDLEKEKNPLIRIHSECFTGDLFGSLRCDCGAQLHESLQRISQEGVGVLIYLQGHEGRGIGLASKMEAYNLQDKGKDTVDANLALGFQPDQRYYHAAIRILEMLHLEKFRLLTNNPHKVTSLETSGFTVERVSLQITANQENLHYLKTKKERLNHQFEELF